ncbi:MAG: plastocyanin/azurin family copper-binding protein [Phycisphaeraceae bacterium]
MQPDPHPTDNAPRLLPSLALAFIAIVVALIFAAAFSNRTGPKQTGDAGDDHAMHGGHTGQEHAADKPGHTHGDDDEPQGPNYYAGGLWSRSLGLSALSELALLAAVPAKELVCHSLSWDPQTKTLVAIDVSPINAAQRQTPDKPAKAVVLSIDFAGGEPEADFAIAVRDHMETFNDAEQILIITPLPGEDQWPDFPYDWTFLMTTEKVDILDWAEVEPMDDMPGRPRSGYLLAWLKQAGKEIDPKKEAPAALLLMDLDVIVDRSQAARTMLTIAQRSPYEIVPAMGKPETATADALNLMRAMNLPADDLIEQAMASDDFAVQALAARAIGDLAQQTTDPLGKLTLLAERDDMRVRYEALAACRAIPGRRAAGVVELVEPYAMSDNMRRVYQTTSAQMLGFGEPIPADSRANRLRRLTIDALLAEQRDALVSAILLERTDLPDDQIDQVLKDLAESNGAGPLTSLLNLLEVMNPRTIVKRQPLLDKLAGWRTNELDAQQARLVELFQQDSRPDALKAAAAGALIRASDEPQAVIGLIGADPLLFDGLAYVKDPGKRNTWAPIVIAYALGENDATKAAQIAALDALSRFNADRVEPAVARVLKLAREADDTAVRFAAIRAINALPEAIKPGDIDDLRLTSLTLEAVPGQIKYDKTELTAVAGRPVEITLINPDNMEHNLAITRPGQMQQVGIAISTMNPADAAAIDYIPQGDAVLFHTPMLKAGQTYTLRFIAPTKPGKYPYVCTFPGHWQSMNGTIQFVAP